MKKYLITSLLFFCLHTVLGQSMRDTAFHNVLRINPSNVITDGFNFLVDIPVKYQKETIVIYNEDARIAPKYFAYRNPFIDEQNGMILITPDWEYYATLEKNREKNPGMDINPTIQNKIYHIKWNLHEYKRIDSISVTMNDPAKPIKLNFIEQEIQESESIIYIKECYGSQCCPMDSRWIHQKSLIQERQKFNEENQVNIYINAYKILKGKEGEHCEFYTLSDLSNDQKIKLLLEEKPSELDETKYKIRIPKIAFPTLETVRHMQPILP